MAILSTDPAPTARGSGRPTGHGRNIKLQDPKTWGTPATGSRTQSTRDGQAAAQSWYRLHPRVARRVAWEHQQGTLPLIPGTLIRFEVQHLPGNATPKPLWLRTSDLDLDPAQAQRYWQSYLRRFDLEHTFRFLKQSLGWNAPHQQWISAPPPEAATASQRTKTHVPRTRATSGAQKTTTGHHSPGGKTAVKG